MFSIQPAHKKALALSFRQFRGFHPAELKSRLRTGTWIFYAVTGSGQAFVMVSVVAAFLVRVAVKPLAWLTLQGAYRAGYGSALIVHGHQLDARQRLELDNNRAYLVFLHGIDFPISAAAMTIARRVAA